MSNKHLTYINNSKETNENQPKREMCEHEGDK